MRRVVTVFLAAGLVFAVAAPASAGPLSSNPTTDTGDAAAWLAGQVNASGFIAQASNPTKPLLSVSAQAVTALAAAAVAKTKVTALVGYLGAHINDFVASTGVDDPGSLGYLILAATAAGAHPSSFGPSHVDLVGRLVATQQPNGLFGSADPTFDGAFREGLALLALHAAAVANSSGVAWLEHQQCADGSWTAFRANTTVPCPPVDPNAFTGPDTNSTALAILGLHAQGVTAQASNGVAALDTFRNTQGGWGFLARNDQATDANSTGLVLEALRTVNGTADAKGIAALLSLQVGCTGAVADRGGIAFQPDAGGKLTPDALATAQATPALAEVALPITSATISTAVPTPCAASTSTSTPTTIVSAGSTTPTSTSTTVAVVGAAHLPRTGTSSLPLVIIAAGLLAVGIALNAGARQRRHETQARHRY
jgi:hypothetical protein